MINNNATVMNILKNQSEIMQPLQTLQSNMHQENKIIIRRPKMTS
jgi:hypothetical protein